MRRRPDDAASRERTPSVSLPWSSDLTGGEEKRAALVPDDRIVWWGPAATGLEGARRLVAHALDVLATAAPREWRAASAQLYTERLDELLRGCEKVALDVEEADAQVRLLEAELADVRTALRPPALSWGAR